ncbi:MAG: hypothetical protein PHV06_09605, partial [bacterium]|nr:hypothetical protein [bacterium]
MDKKEDNIKPVYSTSVYVFSLFWACMPFGYIINILGLIISLMYFKKTLKKTSDDKNIYYLKRNLKTYQYTFLIGTILGIIITIFLFELIEIKNSYIFDSHIFYGLYIIALLLLFISLIYHRDNRKKYSGKFFLVINSIIFIILIIIFLIFCVIPNMIYVRSGKTILKSCSANLRNLGLMIENYASDHKGHYPQSLEVLETLGYIETKLPGCYKTGKPYKYSVDGWDSETFTVWCPNPEVHFGTSGPQSRCASLYYTSGMGTNQVDMDYDEAQKIIKKEMEIQRQKDKKKRILILSIIFSTIFTGLLIYILILIPDYLKERKKRQVCINNLMEFGITLANYSIIHPAQYPEKLELLVEEEL